ncbi:MAG: four helix bundle protein, partial [Bacteroidota bacterium]
MNSYKGYKELDCYKKSRELRIYISNLTKKFPSEEKYLLISQSKISSRSVTATIAEGYGRYTYTDTRNFFVMARGSVTETMEHIATAFDENYITEDEFKTGNEMCETSFKLINGYISWLDKSKAHTKVVSNPIPNSQSQIPNQQPADATPH